MSHHRRINSVISEVPEDLEESKMLSLHGLKSRNISEIPFNIQQQPILTQLAKFESMSQSSEETAKILSPEAPANYRGQLPDKKSELSSSSEDEIPTK